MPIVEVKYNFKPDMLKVVRVLTPRLPGIIAQGLNIPNREDKQGRVTPDDIIIHCTENGELDINTKDIEITVYAHSFPERLVNFEERKDSIMKYIDNVLRQYAPNVSGFVWIFLLESEFGKFKGGM